MSGDFAWVYPYQEENRAEGAGFLRKPLLRPAVRLRLVGDRPSEQIYLGLVDSGSDHVLAPEWVARAIGVAPDPDREIAIRIGGARRAVRFADVRVQLLPPEVPAQGGPFASEPHEWEAQVGFYVNWQEPPWLVVLGQCGFFDRFTVVMNRESAAVAVTPLTAFDERFGVAPAPPFQPRPRFDP